MQIPQAQHEHLLLVAPVRGDLKTRLEHVTGACALNFHRLEAWWSDRSLDRSRTSHLGRLEINLATKT
ncbi:hypothetical protein ACIGXI_36200 [Kitasatospora aureofaciens]|uniref:hypothetical protein n=1 Tax=Kitasatospora aureofaciens TaxID=1894 RepID=UPI0037C72A97